MKKTLGKILSGVLFVLLLAAALAFAASADETPTLSVNGASLTLSDSVYLTYSVKIENATPGDVELLIWIGAQKSYEKGTELEAAKTVGYDENYDEYRFRVTKQSMKQMTEEVYVRPYVEIDGAPFYGNTVKYSILEYCLKSKDKYGSLMNAVLNLGAEAQKYFHVNEDHLPTDTYYLVKVEGGTFPDGFTKAAVKAGETVTLTAAPAPEGQMFSHWVNTECANVGVEPTLTFTVDGAMTYYAVYIDEGTPRELAYQSNGDGTCTVTGRGEYTNTEVVIPSTHNGETVTRIAAKAFENQTWITSMILPDTLIKIGNYAFRNCTGLTELTIPAGVTTIGSQPFDGCTSLATIYYNSSYNSSVENNIFSFTGLQRVVLGGRTSIPSFMFYNSTITSIDIPEGVWSIGSEAFYGCVSLTKVVIPKSVTEIGKNAFLNCYHLVEVWDYSSLNIRAGSSGYGYAGAYAIAIYTSSEEKSKLSTDKDGYILYSDGDRKILVGYTGNETNLILPEGITEINQYAFCDCTSLSSVVIPEGVTMIGKDAFYGCESLKSVVIPSSVKTIGDSAFFGCASLTKVEIPQGVTEIRIGAFNNCTSLESVVIPEGVTMIESDAFYDCSLLTIYCEAASKPAGWDSNWNRSNRPVVWNYKG